MLSLDTHTHDRHMRQIVLCVFCFVATVITVMVLIVLTLTATTNQTALQSQFAENASLIFINWNDSLFESVSHVEVVGSLFGSLRMDQLTNSTYGSFLDALNVENSTIVLARLVRKTDEAAFVASVRAEVGVFFFARAFRRVHKRLRLLRVAIGL